MNKRIPINGKGFFPLLAVLMLVAVAVATSVQTAEGTTGCKFTILSAGGGVPLSASFTIGGKTNVVFEVNGNPQFLGPCGGLHTDGVLTVPGIAYAEQGYTYYKSVKTTNGTCLIPPCYTQVPLVEPPVVDPSNYRDFVDYQLRSNGRVYQSDGAGGWIEIADATVGKWFGWSFSSPRWVMDEDITMNGSFFIEGDCAVSGSPGFVPPAWQVTLIATGFIEISGNPMAVTNPINADEIKNFLFVAGTDLMVIGNPSQSFEGIMAAHEQVGLSGEPFLNGCVIAEGSKSNEGLVAVSYINGDAVIICNDCSWPMPPEVITIINPF